MRFPIFVQADGHVPGRERGQPLQMQLHLDGPGGPVVAVEVETGGVFSRAQIAALGVEAGANPQVQVIGPGIVPDQVEQGHQTSRFVSVDARREV